MVEPAEGVVKLGWRRTSQCLEHHHVRLGRDEPGNIPIRAHSLVRSPACRAISPFYVAAVLQVRVEALQPRVRPQVTESHLSKQAHFLCSSQDPTETRGRRTHVTLRMRNKQCAKNCISM